MKRLIIATSTAHCYPSLSMTVIKNQDQFSVFMKKYEIEGLSKWETLDISSAHYIQQELNSSQDMEEFNLLVLED